MLDVILDFLNTKEFTNILSSIIVILIVVILYKSISIIINKNMSRLSNKKTATHIKMIKSILRYALVIVTILIVLQINGINVSSMLAGIGIISIIIGFAVQDALKDIIKGFDIIMDSYYQVGDIIKYKDIEGKVLSIGLKTTKVEDIYSQDVVSISNRNIEQVAVSSTMINIDIPLPYDKSLEEAEYAIKDIIKELEKIDHVDRAEYRGVSNFASSSINYHVKVFCNPYYKPQTRRNALTSIAQTLEKHNIKIPYQQIDIHQK